MNTATAEEKHLAEITRRILALSDPLRIILFGSHARGDFDQDSDLDLMVVMEGVTSPRQESNRLLRALRGLLVPVDVLVATPQQLERYAHSPGLVYREVLAEGRVIYERQTAA